MGRWSADLRRFFVAATVLLVLGACALERDQEVLDSPEYKTGYADGCRTANTRLAGIKATIHRNEGLYSTSENYRIGWGDGYANCGGPEQVREGDIFPDGFTTPGQRPGR